MVSSWCPIGKLKGKNWFAQVQYRKVVSQKTLQQMNTCKVSCIGTSAACPRCCACCKMHNSEGTPQTCMSECVHIHKLPISINQNWAVSVLFKWKLVKMKSIQEYIVPAHSRIPLQAMFWILMAQSDLPPFPKSPCSKTESVHLLLPRVVQYRIL